MIDRESSDYQRWRRAAKKLIAALPADGAAILALTNEIGRHLKEGIHELRGRDLARRCKMIAVHHYDDCDKLMGLRGPVIVDSSVKLRAKPETLARLERVIAGIACLQPPCVMTAKT